MKTLKLTPVLLFVLLLSNFSFSQTGWQRINDYRSYIYNDGQYVTNNTIYLCGSFNGIAKSTDNGMNWNCRLTIPENVGFTDMQFFDAQKGIMSGEYSGIYRTLNGGDSWTRIYYPVSSNYVGAVSFVNENTGYLLTKMGAKLLKTLNGGLNWTEVVSELPSTNKIFFINENTGFRNDYMGTNQPSAIQRTTDGGITWNFASNVSYDVKQFDLLNDGSILALTYTSKLLKSTDLCNTWQTLLEVNTSAGKLSIINQNSFVVTHYGNKAKITSDGGQNWTEKNLPSNGNIVANSLGDAIFTAGDFNSGLYKISNNWNEFTDVFQKKIRENLTSVNIFDANNFYIGADSGYVVKSNNGGETLSKQYVGFPTNSMSFTNINTGFAAYRNKLCKTVNAGLSWDTLYRFTPSQPGLFNKITEVNFTNENFGYIVAMDHAASSFTNNYYKLTTNGGNTWSNVAQANSSGQSSGWHTSSVGNFKMFTSGTGYYINCDASGSYNNSTESFHLYKTLNYGSSWTDILVNTPYTKIYSLSFINENTGIALVESNIVVKTTDGGNNWTVLNNAPASVDKLYMIDAMNAYAIDLIDFYRTTDGGNTWRVQHPDLNITTGFNKISFLNPIIGLIIGRDGIILKTSNGGNVSIGNLNSELADKYSLSQNYPNPFNPETKIQFSIPKNGLVKIVVYDMLGREVKELVNEFKQQGSYNVSFNGANISSGIYFYKLITDDFVETKKMILVK